MTYVPETPTSTSSPQSSVNQIEVNFSKFDSIFSSTALGVFYNHMPLNDANQGKHAAVIMQNQTTDPGVTEDLAALYAKNATAATGGTQPEVFVQIPQFLPISTAPNVGMQLTYPTVNVAGPIYQSFLPGGFVFYFGSTNTIGTPITLTPTPTSILCAHAVPQGTSASGGATNVPYDVGVVVTQPATIKINSTRAPGGATFLWMAIAKQ